jgi:hypothetical protein
MHTCNCLTFVTPCFSLFYFCPFFVVYVHQLFLTIICTGQYALLLSGDCKWAVVDFRGMQKEVKREPHANTYHVSFNDEFTKFTLCDPEGNERQYSL